MTSNDIMFMNWQSLIKPKKVEVSSTPSYGKFVCEPLERGFGAVPGHPRGIHQGAGGHSPPHLYRNPAGRAAGYPVEDYHR